VAAGRRLRNIARELTRRGHEITILTAHLKGLPLDETVENIRILRLPSLRKYPYQAGFQAMSMYILAAIRAGLPLIHHWRPDIIHVHFAVPAGAAAWTLSRLTGIPYVLTAHLGDIPGGVPEKTGGWFRWFPFYHTHLAGSGACHHCERVYSRVDPAEIFNKPNCHSQWYKYGIGEFW